MEREDCCFPFFLLHLFFPLLLHWVYCLPMIAWLLLIAIGIGILLLTGTFLWHLWLGVQYVPTPAKVVESMVDLAKLRPDDCVLDLGAGDGRFLVAAKKRCPQIRAIGYELVPSVWLWGWLKTRGFHPPVQFLLGDARKADVSQATVVFLYMAPHLMSQLFAHFQSTLRPGTRIISYTFTLPGRTPVASASLVPGGRLVIHSYVW